jgi:hypothetical protein
MTIIPDALELLSAINDPAGMYRVSLFSNNCNPHKHCPTESADESAPLLLVLVNAGVMTGSHNIYS